MSMNVPELPPRETATLVGGPADGREVTADFIGHHVIKIPVLPPWTIAEYFADQPAPTPRALGFQVALYEQVIVDDYPSRDDTGRLRYRYTGSY